MDGSELNGTKWTKVDQMDQADWIRSNGLKWTKMDPMDWNTTLQWCGSIVAYKCYISAFKYYIWVPLMDTLRPFVNKQF